MPSYEARYAEFERHDAEVLGISADSIPSHVAFAKSLGNIEKYPLLADFHPKGEVARKYGVWIDGKGISERAVIIVDKQGRIAYIGVHAIGERPEIAQIIEELRALS